MYNLNSKTFFMSILYLDLHIPTQGTLSFIIPIDLRTIFN